MYILILLFDVATGRLFPSYARWVPLPGEDPTVDRWKSGGNHRTGFDTLDEARAEQQRLAASSNTPAERVWSERFMPFDSRKDADPTYVIFTAKGQQGPDDTFIAEADFPRLRELATIGVT